MKSRIQWHMKPNPNIAYLNVDVRLWDSIRSECFEIEITSEQQLLIDTLNEIHGIVEVGVGIHELRITKGVVFDWSEIRPRVESVFAEWSNCELVEVEPPSCRLQFAAHSFGVANW